MNPEPCCEKCDYLRSFRSGCGGDDGFRSSFCCVVLANEGLVVEVQLDGKCECFFPKVVCDNQYKLNYG